MQAFSLYRCLVAFIARRYLITPLGTTLTISIIPGSHLVDMVVLFLKFRIVIPAFHTHDLQYLIITCSILRHLQSNVNPSKPSPPLSPVLYHTPLTLVAPLVVAVARRFSVPKRPPFTRYLKPLNTFSPLLPISNLYLGSICLLHYLVNFYDFLDSIGHFTTDFFLGAATR